MKMTVTQSILRCAFVGWSGVALATLASAQGYPSKPVRIISPYAPGSTIDIIARIISPM